MLPSTLDIHPDCDTRDSFCRSLRCNSPERRSERISSGDGTPDQLGLVQGDRPAGLRLRLRLRLRRSQHAPGSGSGHFRALLAGDVEQEPPLRHLALDVAVNGAVVLAAAQQLGPLAVAGVVDRSAGDPT